MSERAARVPAGARFRRAEGVEVLVRLCDWPRRVLARWEASDLLFWSSAKPTRALGGAPLEDDGGPIALARNAFVGPLVARGGELAWFDFMPRRGELSGAELVGADLTAWEWHEAVLRARVVCCARHGAVLRWLVSRLDGRHDRALFVVVARPPGAAADPELAGAGGLPVRLARSRRNRRREPGGVAAPRAAGLRRARRRPRAAPRPERRGQGAGGAGDPFVV